tara:strand:+ start:102 stop:251 length:150 start_codon:yes stop_codon:yes gene_type:complete
MQLGDVESIEHGEAVSHGEPTMVMKGQYFVTGDGVGELDDSNDWVWDKL